MQISELERTTGVPAKTIRYYESVELLPAPRRRPNGYRVYGQADVDRLRLVAGARRLDFSLAEIREILDLRDRGEAPCLTLLQGLADKRAEIERRIAELLRVKKQLAELHRLGMSFPTDDVEGKNCVCHLVSEQQ